jgi:hypothetical protein
MPRSRRLSNSSLTNRGRSPPVLASVWVMGLAARFWISQGGVVCSDQCCF